MPFRIVLWQVVATLVVAVAAGAIGGVRAALSAALGGASCALPNALFAARLALAAMRPGGASPVTFFTGELVKVASTVLLLFGSVWLYRDLSWPAFVAGVIVALKSYFVVLLIRK